MDANQQVENIGELWFDTGQSFLYLWIFVIIALVCDAIYYCLRKKPWSILYEDLRPPLILTPFIMVSELTRILKHSAELFDKHAEDFNDSNLNNSNNPNNPPSNKD